MSFLIRSSACYLPKERISAEQLDEQLKVKQGTCRTRYGVDFRLRASPSETALYMGAEAVKQALATAALSIADIDLLLCASGTNHQALPYNAAGILHTLQTKAAIASMDINATCLSFLAALEMAQLCLESGRYRRVLIVSSEVARVGVREDIADVSTLFADGAAAFLLEACDRPAGLVGSLFKTYPAGYSYCQIRAGGSNLHPVRLNDPQKFEQASYFEMQGKPLYKLVAKLAPKFIDEGLKRSNLTLKEIDYVVPHQASDLGVKHMTKLLGMSPQKVVNVFAQMGNQIAASLPIALHHLLDTKAPPAGSKIMLFGSAAGLSLGFGVLQL